MTHYDVEISTDTSPIYTTTRRTIVADATRLAEKTGRRVKLYRNYGGWRRYVGIFKDGKFWQDGKPVKP